jgi:glycine betaine/proline transport system ATP-binding protein
MVFQNFGLLPHKNVLDNAAYGLEVKGIEKHERYELAREVLAKVGLEGWETSNQRELSGGMQQRVGLARALAMDPSILLMDEPFSGLDPLIRRQMRTELSTLQQEIQKTIIFITHDLDEAITVGDRIAIMRDGEIIQLGTPEEIITNPVDSFVEEFTEGIPKTKIINISNIISEASTFTLPTSTADILGLMDQKQSDYAVSVDQSNKYLGTVVRDDINITSNDSTTDISAIMNPILRPIHPETTLEAALTVMSRETLAVPVTDSSNTFLGMVTPQDLLRTLANSQ